MQEKGQSVLSIQKLMRQIGPLLHEGKLEEADQLVTEALKLISEEQ